MYFLSWIFIGAVSGWLAGKILKGNDYGPAMDTGMGIGGAILGGLLMRSARWDGFNGPITTTAVAVVSAGIFAVSAGLVNGRRMSARQL